MRPALVDVKTVQRVVQTNNGCIRSSRAASGQSICWNNVDVRISTEAKDERQILIQEKDRRGSIKGGDEAVKMVGRWETKRG